MKLNAEFRTVFGWSTVVCSIKVCLRQHEDFLNSSILFLVCNISTKSWSNRIFQLCWRICAVLLISVYAGCLVAALALEQVLLPFTDLKGLTEAVKRNEYKICLPNTTAFFTAVMVIIKRLLFNGSYHYKFIL